MGIRNLFIFFLIFISCKTQKEATKILKWEKQSANITIMRDDFGVPHIYGKTDADAVFGLLYAQCEDDFKRVEQNYIWAIGRLAEVEGESELYSDLRARMFMTREEAIEMYDTSPVWLKKLCNAFADGINYYLHTHPEVKPRLLTRFEPWMPMYFSEGSIGGDIERIPTKGIQAFYENDPGFSWINHMKELTTKAETNEPAGSNGIAISGTRTDSGNTLLLINPHTSFYFRGEVHVVSEEGLNAYGAVTWGQFFVYQGFNEKTGWMHTSAYLDVIDEFIEDVVEKDGKYYYQYGEEKREMETDSTTLKYMTDEGMMEKSFPIYRTHHGPVTGTTEGKWISTAMMWDPPKALEQSYIRTKLSNYDEFRDMMNIRTNSSNNTVYADASGNIAYFHGNFVPIKSETLNYREPVDGSNPNTDWKGLHPVNECIVVLNPENGWIQNCNSTPFTCCEEFSPKVEDYPSYMNSPPENFRGIHAQRLLKDVNHLNLDKLIDLAHDPSLPGFEKLIGGLISAFDQSSDKKGIPPQSIELLRGWDFKTSIESVPMSLAHYYGTLSNQSGTAPDTLSRSAKIDYYGTDSPFGDRLSLFKETIDKLNLDFGTWETPWGEINRFQRLSGDIDLKYDDQAPSIPIGFASGNWGALASYGSQVREGTKRIYGSSGNSFVAVVEFGEKLKAKSMLAGGQSGNPESPHFLDQAQAYANKKFKEVAFYRVDVERRAQKVYHPGEKE